MARAVSTVELETRAAKRSSALSRASSPAAEVAGPVPAGRAAAAAAAGALGSDRSTTTAGARQWGSAGSACAGFGRLAVEGIDAGGMTVAGGVGSAAGDEAPLLGAAAGALGLCTGVCTVWAWAERPWLMVLKANRPRRPAPPMPRTMVHGEFGWLTRGRAVSLRAKTALVSAG